MPQLQHLGLLLLTNFTIAGVIEALLFVRLNLMYVA